MDDIKREVAETILSKCGVVYSRPGHGYPVQLLNTIEDVGEIVDALFKSYNITDKQTEDKEDLKEDE